MVQAAAGALATLFGSQSRRETTERPVSTSVLPVIAAAPDKKTQSQLLKAAREERIYNLLAQPEILGFFLTLLGIYVSNNIRFSQDDQQNTLLQSVSTTATVGLGLGYAGVGDLTGVSIAAAAGGASLIGSLLGDIELPDLGGSGGSWWNSLFPFGGILNLLGVG